MKRFLKFIPFLLLPFVITGCGKEEVAYRTIKEIRGDGTVNIAFSTDRYPFMNRDVGAYDNETMKEKDKIYHLEEQIIGNFVKKNAVKVNLIKTSRAEVTKLIADGSADIAFGKIEKNESDKFRVNQSLIFAKEEPYVITNKGVTVFNLHDLADKKVALISDTPLTSLVKSDVSGVASDIKQYKSLDNAVDQLLLYNIDAIVCYKNEAENVVVENTDTLEINTLADGKMLEYVGLVAKGNDELLTEINNAINEYFYPTLEEEEI